MWHKSLIIFILTAAMSMSVDVFLLSLFVFYYSEFVKNVFWWIQGDTVINFYLGLCFNYCVNFYAMCHVKGCVFFGVLLVPQFSTIIFGFTFSSSPLAIRHKIFSIKSPLILKFNTCMSSKLLYISVDTNPSRISSPINTTTNRLN